MEGVERPTHQEVNDYLYYGYLPSRGNIAFMENILSLESESKYQMEETLESWIDQGVVVLNKVFDDLVTGKERDKHLVPLSGGLDSRMIFAALLERVPSENIHVVTFGSPRTFDFEIPPKLVKGKNVKFERINCLELDYSIENLSKAVIKGGKWTYTPDMYINQQGMKLDENCHRWSGFMGGAVSGRFSKGRSSDIFKAFAERERRVKSCTLTDKSYDPVLSLFRKKKFNSLFTENEVATFYNRTAGMSIPVIFPHGVDIIAPHIHKDWLNFIFRAPHHFRKNSLLFNEILMRMFPEIMKFPCKNNAGLPLGQNNPLLQRKNLIKLKMRYELTRFTNNLRIPPIGANYLHYKVAFKKLPTLRRAIEDSCTALEERKIIPWISPKLILKEHLTGKKDHNEALQVFLGLEANLRSMEVNKSQGI